LKTQLNVNLNDFNTLGFDSIAKEFYRVCCIEELSDLYELLAGRPCLILGGGSNLVLPEEMNFPVVSIELKGKTLNSENDEFCIVEVNAGENWHQLVKWSVNKGLWGIENLSLIPGNVGTAPVQNIGAYGVEIKDVLQWVEFFNLEKGRIERFSNSDCDFSYRNSVFKSELLGKAIITKVAIKLWKEPNPVLNYHGLESFQQDAHLTSEQISDAICQIRNKKLPDPEILPNVGSFFKNPMVSLQQYQKLKKQYPELVAYQQGERWKIAAAWLIEKAQFKGMVRGHVGVHKDQALVLVHFGGGNATELLSLAKDIQRKVSLMFGVELEPEARIINESQPYGNAVLDLMKER